MIELPMTLNLADGLETRPIALLVQEASNYSSTIYVQVDNKKINAKSIMGMMSINLQYEQPFTVLIEGDDEKKAAEGLEIFFQRLGEGKN